MTFLKLKRRPMRTRTWSCCDDPGEVSAYCNHGDAPTESVCTASSRAHIDFSLIVVAWSLAFILGEIVKGPPSSWRK
jgi:hypothetical protein